MNHHTADIVSDMMMKDLMSKQKDLKTCYEPLCDGAIIIEDRYLAEFRCPVCNKRNCLKCKKIHNGNEQCPPPPKPKPVIKPLPFFPNHGGPSEQQNRGNYHFTKDEFANHWVNVQDIRSSDMVQSFDVPRNSEVCCLVP